MNCEQVRENLAAFIDGELDEKQIAEVQVHLEGCAGCRQELESLRRTARALEELLEPRAMKESVADSVLSTLASGRGKASAGLLTRVGWALTGAAAAVLILAVFGFLGIEGGGKVALADELVDEALADHTNTFDLFKKQVIHSTVNDPSSEVRIIRADLQISGLREKTTRLEQLLKCSNHPRKDQITSYIVSVCRLMDYVDDPPLESAEAIFPALRKTAMNINPVQGMVMVRVAALVETNFTVPKGLGDREKRFMEGKGWLYRGNFARAAQVFKLVVEEAPESHIREFAKYWKKYAEFHTGTYGISIESKGKGCSAVPRDPGLKEEMRKDFMNLIKRGGDGFPFAPGNLEQMLEMGKKIGIHVETTQDKDGNTCIKVDWKDRKGGSSSHVIKLKSSQSGKNAKENEEE